MADGLAVAIANGILDDLVAGGFYVQLHLGDPGAAGTANPATETTRKSTTMAAASGGASTNSATVEWTSYPAQEEITHVSFWDAASAGTFLGKRQLVASKTPEAGDTVQLAAGDLDFALAVAS